MTTVEICDKREKNCTTCPPKAQVNITDTKVNVELGAGNTVFSIYLKNGEVFFNPRPAFCTKYYKKVDGLTCTYELKDSNIV